LLQNICDKNRWIASKDLRLAKIIANHYASKKGTNHMTIGWRLGRPKKSASKLVKTGSPADRIVNDMCGGVAEVNRHTGIAPSTIQSWLKSGRIPPTRRAIIESLAKQKGHKLSDADFVMPNGK
jgi:hypothetical protein